MFNRFKRQMSFNFIDNKNPESLEINWKKSKAENRPLKTHKTVPYLFEKTWYNELSYS